MPAEQMREISRVSRSLWQAPVPEADEPLLSQVLFGLGTEEAEEDPDFPFFL